MNAQVPSPSSPAATLPRPIDVDAGQATPAPGVAVDTGSAVPSGSGVSSGPTLARPAKGRQMRVPASEFEPEDATVAGVPSCYRIGRRLGAGGMAEVFVAMKADCDGSERPVVIKRPLPHLARQPEFLTMFIDEVRIASTLDHPNVVHVEEFVQEGGTCFMVMELVDGRSLSSVLARSERLGHRLGSRLSAYAVARIAAGLHYAHTRTDGAGQPLQIVHRDVSPQNVLVSYTGEVKVIDFGIARALDRATRTRTGTRKGKTGYMAPEQAKSGSLDHRVDVFALGIILWEALCGRRLFLRPDEFRTMNALLIDPIPAPSSLAAVPAELERITLRALERNPDERYQSAEELRRDLDAFVASTGAVVSSELGDLVRGLFADEPSIVPDPAAPEIGPAVITNPTVAGKVPEPGRRQALFLGLGAVAAAGVGLALGWVGKRMGTKAVTAVSAGPPVGASAPAPRPDPSLAPGAPAPRSEVSHLGADAPDPPSSRPAAPRASGPKSVEPVGASSVVRPGGAGQEPEARPRRVASSARAQRERRRAMPPPRRRELSRKSNPF